jgi:hypothetical protein
MLQWKSSKHYIFWLRICSLMYPACNAHAHYCHQWPARPYNIFLHYLKTARISKKFTDYKTCILMLWTTFIWNISNSKNSWARCENKCIFMFMWSSRYSCHILMKLEYSRRIFEKKLNINLLFHADGRTGRHSETNSRTSGDALGKYCMNVLLAQYIWRIILGNVFFVTVCYSYSFPYLCSVQLCEYF